MVAAGLVVDDLGVFLVGVKGLPRVLCCSLAMASGVHMCLLATGAPGGILAAGVQRLGQHRVVAEGGLVRRMASSATSKTPMPPTCVGGAAEELVHQRLLQADGLEDLRAAVGHVGADAHLGHDLGQALADGLT